MQLIKLATPSSAQKLVRNYQGNIELPQAMGQENRSKSGLDMSHILEDPEFVQKRNVAQREESNEAVREWTNETKHTDVDTKRSSHMKIKNQSYKFIRGNIDSNVSR